MWDRALLSAQSLTDCFSCDGTQALQKELDELSVKAKDLPYLMDEIPRLELEIEVFEEKLSSLIKGPKNATSIRVL